MEPENRLVARTLEERWNAALARVEELKNQARSNHEQIRPLSEHERARAARLAKDLEAVWQATTTTNQDRKQLLRAAIEEVQLRTEAEHYAVKIVWKGGAVTESEVRRRKRGDLPATATPKDTVELVRTLAAEFDDAQIAKLQPPRGRRSRYLGEAQGFGLHAAVCVPAENRFGRELLLRYCGRPPFSLERLSLLPSGHVAYQIKSPWRLDQTHRVMEPLEFLARLAALVPPPRTPLIRFHGAIAPNFPHRNAVVALAPKADIQRNPQSCSTAPTESKAKRRHEPPSERCAPAPDESAKKIVEHPAAAIAACSPPAPSPMVALDAPASRGAPDCDALRSFESAISRIDWATLLHRVYDIDALACPCGGRLRFTDLVTDRDEARTILQELRLPATPPPISPAHAAPDILDLPPPDP